jgi:hypothetical protein
VKTRYLAGVGLLASCTQAPAPPALGTPLLTIRQAEGEEQVHLAVRIPVKPAKGIDYSLAREGTTIPASQSVDPDQPGWVDLADETSYPGTLPAAITYRVLARGPAGTATTETRIQASRTLMSFPTMLAPVRLGTSPRLAWQATQPTGLGVTFRLDVWSDRVDSHVSLLVPDAEAPGYDWLQQATDSVTGQRTVPLPLKKGYAYTAQATTLYGPPERREIAIGKPLTFTVP